MRIAHVEQFELGNIMELSVTGHVQKLSNLPRKAAEQSMEVEESQSPDRKDSSRNAEGKE